MSSVKNIIISSSRMWNCGDDFIAYGVRHLIDDATGQRNNYVVYNRNPDLHLQRAKFNTLAVEIGGNKTRLPLAEYVAKTNWVYDNSWHTRNGVEDFDACVFAGTPEWWGPMVEPLNQQLKSSKTPVMYLGVGGYEGREQYLFDNLPQLDREVLSKAALVTVRDQQAESLLKEVNAVRLPCPALFSFDKERVAEQGSLSGRKLRIALTTQPDSPESAQPTLNKGTYDYTLKLFQAIIASGDFECEVVCHYVDEIQPLKSLGVPVRYSYDAKEYFDIFREYDLLVTTRVHGAGAASSLGIPSFVVKHSARSDTVDGFLSQAISLDEPVEKVLARIQDFDIESHRKTLVAHKRSTLEAYRKLLPKL